jgi:7,8-dihydroneopterin aldolase/epimerase/oxygenase
MSDLIRISDLEVDTLIGVGEEERSNPQRLLLSLDLRVKDIGPAAFTDNIHLTVDYSAVAERVRVLAASRPRHLIETLAEEISADLLKSFPIVGVRLELRKFYALPGAHHVSILIERPLEGRAPSAYRPSPTMALRMTRDPGLGG